MQAKRQNAYILALLVFCFSVFPAKPSLAVVPIAIGLTMQAFGAGGSVVSANLLTSGVTALVGATIFGLGMAATEMGDGTNPVGLRIPTIDDPAKIAAAMPSPSAPPSANGEPNYVYTSQNIAGNYSSPAAICSARIAQLGGINGGCPSNYVFNAGAPESVGADGCRFLTACVSSETGSRIWEGYENVPVSKTASGVTCAAGYTSNGSTCALSNARAVTPDSQVDVVRSPSGFSLPVQGSDVDPVPQYASANGGKVYVSGKDSSGRPVAIEYAVSPDGTKTYVTHYTQSDAGGQSVVNTQGITIDAATGAVTASNASAAQGSITGIGTGAVPVVTTGTAVTPTTGTVAEPIVFPSDYARAGEAANAANVVKGAIDAAAAPLTPTAEVSDPTVPEYVDPWGMTFGALRGWSLPGHASTCPTAGFNWNNSTFVLDAHCQLVADHFGVLQAAMSVVWVVLSLFVVLGA